jgi:hypothetical protein
LKKALFARLSKFKNTKNWVCFCVCCQ